MKSTPPGDSRAGYQDRVFRGPQLDRVAFPLGGIGAGMICMEGTGAFAQVSIHHAPDVSREAAMFGALWVKGIEGGARVLEGPVPRWKAYGPSLAAIGSPGKLLGLPGYSGAAFPLALSFGFLDLEDPVMPVSVLTGWSPFVRWKRTLPAAGRGTQYELTNQSSDNVRPSSHPRELGGLHAWREGVIPRRAESARSPPDSRWNAPVRLTGPGRPRPSRSTLTLRTAVTAGSGEAGSTLRPPCGSTSRREIRPPPDRLPMARPVRGSIYVPVSLNPGESRAIRIHVAWYVPVSDLRYGEEDEPADQPAHVPWYAGASTESRN
jgi:hypothetical protein